MKKYFVPALFAAALLAPQTVAAQTYVGYTTKHTLSSTADKRNGKGFNTESARQGVAIRLSAAKAATLKGARITGLRLATSSRQLSELRLFVTKDLNGTPLSETVVTSYSGSNMADYALTTPVEIDGSEIYVGYYAQLTNSGGIAPCLFESTNDFGAGTVWGFTGTKWDDVSASGEGVPTLQLILDNAPASVVDAVVKPAKQASFYKVNTPNNVQGEVFNFGTAPITSLKLQTQLGDNAAKTVDLTGLNIQPNTSYTFDVNDIVASQEGELSLRLSVLSVNGGTDADASDNESNSAFYVYPADVKRRILLEKFTGQDCNNCVRGDVELHAIVDGHEDDYAVVAHHIYPASTSGLYDIFAMQESFSIGSWFYNSSQSYAPAAMVNRAPWKSGLTTVVFGKDDGLTSSLNAGISLQNQKEPYVGVDMDNTYDATTRKGQVTIKVHTYRVPSSAQHAINLYLTQSKVYANQSGGGSNYEHNYALRQVYTGTWGTAIDLVPGETVERTYTYEIPDAIESTAQGKGYKLPTDPANMDLVAFVSDATNDPLTCVVYNANTIPVTTNGSTTGIQHTQTQAAAVPSVSESGVLSVLGAYRKAEVYNLEGRQVGVLTGAATLQLAKGVYVVRVDGTSSKVLVK